MKILGEEFDLSDVVDYTKLLNLIKETDDHKRMCEDMAAELFVQCVTVRNRTVHVDYYKRSSNALRKQLDEFRALNWTTKTQGEDNG
tara:strand:+ start:280 stop:540 length:261 start_codon:yes stop_codon:yes gene_type:complete